MAKLTTGSDRTNGASINTGTVTKNTAAANINQVLPLFTIKGKAAEACSVDSNSLISLGCVSLGSNSVLIAVLEVVYEDKVLLIKILIIVTKLYITQNTIRQNPPLGHFYITTVLRKSGHGALGMGHWGKYFSLVSLVSLHPYTPTPLHPYTPTPLHPNRLHSQLEHEMLCWVIFLASY
ncbi:MAG: hypothetical protein ACRAVC_20845 [Trichormus sp.]